MGLDKTEGVEDAVPGAFKEKSKARIKEMYRDPELLEMIALQGSMENQKKDPVLRENVFKFAHDILDTMVVKGEEYRMSPADAIYAVKLIQNQMKTGLLDIVRKGDKDENKEA